MEMHAEQCSGDGGVIEKVSAHHIAHYGLGFRASRVVESNTQIGKCQRNGEEKEDKELHCYWSRLE